MDFNSADNATPQPAPSFPQPTVTSLIEPQTPFDPYENKNIGTEVPPTPQPIGNDVPPAPPLAQYAEAPKKKTFIKWIILGVVLFIAFIIVGFGATGVMAAYDKVTLPANLQIIDDIFTKVASDVPFFPKTSKMVLVKSATQHSKVSSAYIELSSAVDVDSDELKQLFMNKPMEILIKGPVDFGDPKNISTSLNINIANEFISDLVIKDQNLYFQITKIPAFLFLALGVMGVDNETPNPIMNRWVHSSIEALDTEASQALQNDENNPDKFIEEKIAKFANDKLLPRMSLTTEKENNEDVFKIQMNLRDEEIKEFMKIMYEDKTVVENELMAGDVASIDNIDATFLFGKSDYLMRKLVVVMTIKSNVKDAYSRVLGRNTNIMDEVEASEGQTVKVSAALTMSRHGEKFDIKIPESNTEMEAWLMEVGNFINQKLMGGNTFQNGGSDSFDGFSDDSEGFESDQTTSTGSAVAIQFANARNATRRQDISAILNAVSQYIVENRGQVPNVMTGDNKFYQLGTCSSGGNILCKDAEPTCVNFGAQLSTYIKRIPTDTVVGSDATSGYAIRWNSNTNDITVKSCSAELGESIEITR